eukprot:CAMPEP_0185715882 /NCGR_PEP_ID=MMETSP1164-20130828/41709_1 /TAXON_ID=1104430 /ORGANISM="Chrysoreinhardia sp, Strain CCMP2950" /LENGTH=446 /DNA_ID=CAMNT_0028383485 /DNA_START=83 /DNA_END=1423 /DNA_ORIENTATION=+
MSHPFWLLTAPNEGRTAEQTFEKLRRSTEDAAKAYLVQIPSLTVGTLDSLMSLSEDMEKFDSAIEVAVRKIERQYAEVAQQGPGGAKPVAPAGSASDALLIDGVPVERYLPSFVWEHAKYPHRRALPELVGALRSTVGSIEEELKHLATTYAEKTQKLQTLSRARASAGGSSAAAAKSGGTSSSSSASASTAPLEEVLPPECVAKTTFLDTEYLVTAVVVVPRVREAEWLASYAGTIGGDLVEATSDASGANTAGSKCSPAVPGSSEKLWADADTAVYTVTLLKGRHAQGEYVEDQWQPGAFTDFFSAYAAAAKDAGFVVRKFEYDAEAVAKNDRDREDLVKDVDRLHASILRWCKAHFAEAFVAWIHLKVVRAFVESVLRYGLPVDFVTAILVPSKNRDAALQSSLDSMFAHLKVGDSGFGPVDDAKDAGEYHAYVLQKAVATTI